MVINGHAIAQEMLTDVAARVSGCVRVPTLTIITAAPNLETKKYLSLKRRKGTEIGVAVNVIELVPSATTDEVVTTVTVAADQSDGVIVQLPLPQHIDTGKVLSAVPQSHDVDGVHYDGKSGSTPPVIGAIDEIAKRNAIDFTGKRVVVIGAGVLVGTPALLYMYEQGAEEVTVLTADSTAGETQAAVRSAEVIVAGAGVPGLVTADAVTNGVLIFDAGTSEVGGALAGDVAPEVAQKAGLFTPVPGGIGPITVACLFANLVTLCEERNVS